MPERTISLAEFAPEGKLAVNFQRQAERLLAAIEEAIKSGDLNTARNLIASSAEIFSQLAPERTQEIQDALDRFFSSKLNPDQEQLVELEPTQDEQSSNEPMKEVESQVEQITFGGLFQSAADVIAVASAAGIKRDSVQFMYENGRVPNEVDDESPQLIMALARRAVAVKILTPLKARSTKLASEESSHGQVYLSMARQLAGIFQAWAKEMEAGKEVSQTKVGQLIPFSMGDTQPNMATAQARQLIEDLATDGKQFVALEASQFGITAKLKKLKVDYQNSTVSSF